ncbi:MAG: Bug family tripartite tricarboxylate transporter substrate binding protein [Beijerinckiaceae bacterium]
MRAYSFLFGLALALSPAVASAQSSVADFYKGRQVRIIVGFAAGGNSGLYGDVLGRHMGKHLPGAPTFVPQYMPGGGGLVAANHMANRAARDGSEIAITSRTAAFEPILGNKQAQFDGRAFNWLGSANVENSVCIADNRQSVRTFDDVRKSELVVGGSGSDAIDMIFPRLANRLLGAKFKIVSGYNTSNDILLAMERGEVHGFCGVGWSFLKLRKAELLSQNKVSVLFQIALEKAGDLPDAPLIQDLANAQDRQVLEFLLAPQGMGRPFFAPPDVPKERVAALRQAFADTMRDPEFLKEAAKTGLDIQFVSGDSVDKILSRSYATPPELVARAKDLLHGK